MRDGNDDRRTVSFQVFAENLSVDALFDLMGRQFGPVRHVRLPTARSEQGMCVVIFESDYAANKAVGMSKRGSSIYYPHLDLKVDWGVLEIFRGDQTRASLPRSTPRSPSVAAYNSNFSSGSASAMAAPTNTPFTRGALGSRDESPSVLPTAPTPKATPAVARLELDAFEDKHKNALLANEVLRTRLDYVHRCVLTKREKIKCQEDTKMATMESIQQSETRASYLKAEIEKVDAERSMLLTHRKETEERISEEIKKKAALEVEIVQARKHNAFLEDSLGKINLRTEADRKTRDLRALRLSELDGRISDLSPLIEDTFMTDTVLAAFWKVHQIASDTIEETRIQPDTQDPPTRLALKKVERRRLQ